MLDEAHEICLPLVLCCSRYVSVRQVVDNGAFGVSVGINQAARFQESQPAGNDISNPPIALVRFYALYLLTDGGVTRTWRCRIRRATGSSQHESKKEKGLDEMEFRKWLGNI